jgi:hypothetical protein
MIKHGKIYPFAAKGSVCTHLDPIKEFVTKGIADARENIVLEPLACDVRGAKRFNGQQCVIAKVLTRTLHPQAVAVGRSLCYVVFDGLAIRFGLPVASRKLVEEFDERGRARNAPVELRALTKSQRLGKRQSPDTRKNRIHANEPKRPRSRKYGVRATGGGVAVPA